MMGTIIRFPLAKARIGADYPRRTGLEIEQWFIDAELANAENKRIERELQETLDKWEKYEPEDFDKPPRGAA